MKLGAVTRGQRYRIVIKCKHCKRLFTRRGSMGYGILRSMAFFKIGVYYGGPAQRVMSSTRLSKRRTRACQHHRRDGRHDVSAAPHPPTPAEWAASAGAGSGRVHRRTTGDADPGDGGAGVRVAVGGRRSFCVDLVVCRGVPWPHATTIALGDTVTLVAPVGVTTLLPDLQIRLPRHQRPTADGGFGC